MRDQELDRAIWLWSPEAELARTWTGDGPIGPEQPGHRLELQEWPPVVRDGDLLAELRVLGARVVAEEPGPAPHAEQRQQRRARGMQGRPEPGIRRVRGNGQRRNIGDVAVCGDRGSLLSGGDGRGAAEPVGGFGTAAGDLGHRDIFTGGPLRADQPRDLVGRRPGVAVRNWLVAHLSSWTSRYTT